MTGARRGADLTIEVLPAQLAPKLARVVAALGTAPLKVGLVWVKDAARRPAAAQRPMPGCEPAGQRALRRAERGGNRPGVALRSCRRTGSP